MRFLAWILIHSVYRLAKSGLEHIPDEGAAVLVCNHVSFVDALVIAAACQRPDPLRDGPQHLPHARAQLRFPHRPGDSDRFRRARTRQLLAEAPTTEIARGLERGDLVCIFPEGRITDTRRHVSVPAGHPAHRRAHAGAGRADGAAGSLGQLLQPQGRRCDVAAFSALAVREDRSCSGRAGAREHVTAAALQATVLALRGDQR